MNNRPPTVLIICVTIVAVATLAAVTAVLVSGRSDSATVAVLAGLGGTLVTGVAALAGVQQVKAGVSDLANGRMDAKIRAGVADVLADHYIDPAAVEQIAADRVRRGEH